MLALSKFRAVEDLARALHKIAPDLAAEVVQRFEYAKLTPEERLDRFLRVLHGETP